MAEIRLLQLEDGWRASIDAQLGSRGRSEPLSARLQPHPTRDAALEAAIERLRTWCGAEDDARPVIAWLDTLIPDQPDLFGAAA